MGKKIAIATILVLSLVGVGFAIDWAVFGRHTPEKTPAAEMRPKTVVLSVVGQVERRKTTGEWSPASVGDELVEDEDIRTSADGRATMDVGGQATVSVFPTSSSRFGRSPESLPGSD